MTREEWLARYLGTVWVGGARYWRGQVIYRPTWAVTDLQYREISGWWRVEVEPPKAWFVEIKRLDDNSFSEPRGKRKWVSYNNCFYGLGQCPDQGFLRQLVDARVESGASA